MKEIKNKVEAILFSVGSKMNLDELSSLTKVGNKDKLTEVLNSLQKDYDDRSSPMMLIEEGNAWKLSIRDNFLHLVNNLVSDTELTKSVMETLAVIAWKYPCLQSEIIKIRTNKAYDHMSQLEQLGFISRTKFSRTRKVGLTDKFFQYFDLPRDSFKKLFRDKMSKKAVTKVNQTEIEIDNKLNMIQQYQENKEEFKKQIKSKKQIDTAIMQAAEVETYETKPKIQVIKEEKPEAESEPYGEDPDAEIKEQQEINQELEESLNEEEPKEEWPQKKKEKKKKEKKEEVPEKKEEKKEEVKEKPMKETKKEPKEEEKPEEKKEEEIIKEKKPTNKKEEKENV